MPCLAANFSLFASRNQWKWNNKGSDNFTKEQNFITESMSESKKPEETQFFRPNSPTRRAGLFYKLVVASTLQDKMLKIPNKFAKKFGNDLSDLVTLVVHNGYEWVLELKRCGRRLWFDDGWPGFVDHHCIQVGQLLVFRYEGNSIFNFYMFNLTAASNGLCNSPSSSFPQIDSERNPMLGKEAKYDSLIDLFGSSSPDITPLSLSKKVFPELEDKQQGHGSCNETNFKTFMHWLETVNPNSLKDFDKLQLLKSTGEIGVQFDGDELLKVTGDVNLQLSDEVTRKRKLKAEPIDHYNEPLFDQKCGNITHKVTRMPPGIDEFKPINPFCWIIMRQSYVCRGFHLHIPSKFAEKYLKGVSGFITLQTSCGKQWSVRCIREGHGTKLSKGWSEFVSENNLKEDDVCVFELIDIKDIVLKVTIFRVLEVPTKT